MEQKGGKSRLTMSSRRKTKILLWCYTEETRKKAMHKQTSSDKDKVSGRTSNYESHLKKSEEVEGLSQQLNEKHGSSVESRKHRIAGKFGGDINLAVWRIVRTPPNLNSRQI